MTVAVPLFIFAGMVMFVGWGCQRAASSVIGRVFSDFFDGQRHNHSAGGLFPEGREESNEFIVVLASKEPFKVMPKEARSDFFKRLDEFGRENHSQIQPYFRVINQRSVMRAVSFAFMALLAVNMVFVQPGGALTFKKDGSVVQMPERSSGVRTSLKTSRWSRLSLRRQPMGPQPGR